MAERGGFEPPIPLRVCRISSAVRSTALPPLRRGGNLAEAPAHRKARGSPRYGGSAPRPVSFDLCQMPAIEAPRMPVQAVYPPSGMAPAKTRRFAELLAERLKRERL